MIYDEMVRVLASIHSVDVERAGLNDFGKHGQLSPPSLSPSFTHTCKITYTHFCMHTQPRYNYTHTRCTHTHSDTLSIILSPFLHTLIGNDKYVIFYVF